MESEDSLNKTDMLGAKINFGASKIRGKGLRWSMSRSARRAAVRIELEEAVCLKVHRISRLIWEARLNGHS